ncbi:MAG: hypothetical protein JO352_21455 [Chloroflexi bacterium]|nr:hypothetical protein [Chloroflexota bacterium]
MALEWDRLTGPAWIGMDMATAFVPWYSFLGDQLRAGHIPTWNPYTFSGAPFAADPESGWMYLPAMLAFTLLPLDAAVRANLLFHVLLAGLSTYTLARVLGCNVFGALLAAIVYAHSGFFEGHNVCCFAYADVAAWLPLALLGAELAIQAATWRPRVLGWGVSGFALSQILAAWIGQGAYYAVLVVGSYLAVRALVASNARFPHRVRHLVLNGVGIGVVALGLAAAGLLPRLEYNPLSNLPGGYPDADVSLRATTWNDWGFIANWDRLLLQPGFEYIGWPVLLLSLAALPLLLSRRRPRMIAYFAVLGVAVLILARAQPTPLHAVLSLLPGFEGIHARSPERALIVLYLAPAILAAASLSWLTGTGRKAAIAFGVAAIALVTVDLHSAWTVQAAESLAGGGDYQFARVDLAAYVAATPGAEFLMDQAQSQPAFRYFGYAGHVFGGPMPYTLRWADPAITGLLVDNRAMLTSLDDIEGYNPVHIARYGELIEALNAQVQNYHQTDIYPAGLNSPLLDLLNVRYILMPAHLASDEVAPAITRPLERVYADDTVQVFENPSAFPRAWIVHAARQVAPGAAIAALVGDPPPDLHTVAVLEEPPPPLREPADATRESATEAAVGLDRLRIEVLAAAPGLVVTSEIAYPAWHATLDGRPVPVLVADGALRAVAVPPGEHTIEMRYQSTALNVGLGITLFTAAALVAVAILQRAFSTRLSARSEC